MGRRAANLALASSVFAAFTPALPALAEPDYTTTESGLKYYIVKKAVSESGSYIADGVQINCDYSISTGSFDGNVIESSTDPGRLSLRFTVGTGAVNPALDEAVRGMKPGEVRRVVVPAKFNLDKSGSNEPLYLQLRLR